VSLDKYGMLSYSGCLSLPNGAHGELPAHLPRLAIQYQASPGGLWHQLASAPLKASTCGNGGEQVSGQALARLNLAYYRAYFPGDRAARDAAGGNGGTAGGTTASRYLPAASPTLLAWKFEDRIASLRVSPSVVPAKGTLTVRGVLQYYQSSWHGLPGQPVLIILRPEHTSTWYWITQVTTDAKGQFSATFPDPESATWSAEYLGNNTYLATVAPMDPVRLA
jgi:hypothetical protein